MCAVAYNFFNQPTRIEEDDVSATLNDLRLELSYGANQQRNKMAVYSNDSLYFIHTDHLGSYCAITNNTTIRLAMSEAENACGRQCRQAMRSRWCGGISADLTFWVLFWSSKKVQRVRGFTVHEHYPEFKIINMRLYDPVIGRFFSPDKYVANSSFTQDYNRYTYDRNSPLMYVDPSGHKLKGWQWALIGLGIDALCGGAFSSAALLTGWAASNTAITAIATSCVTPPA